MTGRADGPLRPRREPADARNVGYRTAETDGRRTAQSSDRRTSAGSARGGPAQQADQANSPRPSRDATRGGARATPPGQQRRSDRQFGRESMASAGRDDPPSRGGSGRDDRPSRGGSGRDDRPSRAGSGRDDRAGADPRHNGGRPVERASSAQRTDRHSSARGGATPADSRVPIRDAAAGRMAEPALPEGVDVRALDRDVRADLRSLAAATAETVAKHLVAAGTLVDDDPVSALEHARFARSIAARVGVVREAVGVTAYHAGEWTEALAELRAARRITGDPRWIAVMADCERALQRPERAIKALDDPDLSRVDLATRTEVLVVVAGARRDLGQDEAALLVLARGNLNRARPETGSSRLWYAYADLLAHLGRDREAREWFAAVAALDEDDTDADERAGWDG